MHGYIGTGLFGLVETHNYNSDLIAIMTLQKGVCVTPASVTFRLPV